MNNVMSRILIGVGIIGFGILMLFDNLGYLEFWHVFKLYWPAILIVIGFSYLFRKLWLSAFFFAVIGGLLIALNLDIIDGNLWTYIIPLGVIFIGLGLLLPATARRSRMNNENYYQDQRDVMNQAAILGGSMKKVTTQNFVGGDILAVLGGATLDLRTADLAKKEAHLEITAVMGGVDILIPEDWQVDVRVTSIFGGIGDRRPTLDKDRINEKTLIIHGMCFFGGLDIKN